MYVHKYTYLVLKFVTITLDQMHCFASIPSLRPFVRLYVRRGGSLSLEETMRQFVDQELNE